MAQGTVTFVDEDDITEGNLRAYSYDSAAIDYKVDGLGVTANFAANEISVATGRAAIGYQTERYVVDLEAEETVGFASSSGDNYVYLEFEPIAVGVYDSEGQAPDTSLQIAYVDAATETVEQRNEHRETVEHADQHESGGDDELTVDGLQGDLADPQDPKTHDNSAHNPNFSEEGHDHSGESINPDAITNKDYNEPNPVEANASGAVTIDLSAGNAHRIEAIDHVDISFANVSAETNSLLILIEDSDDGGPYNADWPASVLVDDASDISEVGASSDLLVSLVTFDGGTTWRAMQSGEAFA